MPLQGLLRRASGILGVSQSSSAKPSHGDGEILFSKNNVCVHTPSQFRHEGSSIHHPGYLVVRCRHTLKNTSAQNGSTSICGSGDHKELEQQLVAGSSNTTLTLTWIPNEKLARNHDLISQLNPDVCGSISRSCSPCRFSDCDSISLSSYCCNTDTPCTASLASKSYEESTALVSSEASTTEASTLNLPQLERLPSQDLDLPTDPTLDLPLDNEECITSRLLGASLSTPPAGECDSNLTGTGVNNESSCDSDHVHGRGTSGVVESCPATDMSSASISDNNGCSDTCDNKGKEDDADTGVFLSSGSSGVSTGEIRDLVIGALSNDDIDNKPVTQEDIDITERSNESSLSPATDPNSSVDSGHVDLKNNENFDLKRGTLTTAKSLRNSNKKESADDSLATEEGSAVVGTGEDNSFDSSPEPHIPSYEGIYPSDSEGVWFEGSAESMAYSANLAFPEWPASLASSFSSSASQSFSGASGGVGGGRSCVAPGDACHVCSSTFQHHTPHRNNKVAIFNVDLGEMRSLRLFFSDGTGCRGQLVIASRESQYKILHFHHSGLDKLAAVFEDWNFLVTPRASDAVCLKEETVGEANEGVAREDVGRSPFKQFSVCRPTVLAQELHPDEGAVKELDAEDWLTYFSQEGVIEDDVSLRRRIFLGGLEPQLRSSVWPFLLHCYPYNSTFSQRQQLADHNRELYRKLTERRERLEGEEREQFWRSVQCTVEKDVVRTDRSNPCFAGHDNPNLTKMKNILLNFALHRPDIGYTQGMSDILAPILSEVRCEPDVFWCFTGLMSKTIFVTSPTDTDMEKNLSYLRELLRLMAPDFYRHITAQPDGHFLLFCHRWILLCFKREFPEKSVLSLWEACWSHYQTDYFHLFVAVAVVCVYGGEVTEQHMRPDETLLYFTSLAHHMDAGVVLKKFPSASPALQRDPATPSLATSKARDALAMLRDSNPGLSARKQIRSPVDQAGDKSTKLVIVDQAVTRLLEVGGSSKKLQRCQENWCLGVSDGHRCMEGGSAMLGSAMLGSAVLGSAVLGSAVMGSAVLGSAVMGSAVQSNAGQCKKTKEVTMASVHSFNKQLSITGREKGGKERSKDGGGKPVSGILKPTVGLGSGRQSYGILYYGVLDVAVYVVMVCCIFC
ncbi:Rab-GTPase-TBC domain [Trinorchestia longiramus]|nr:Rab-GTPase-TBC domain [Trinorchestia longiramus]